MKLRTKDRIRRLKRRTSFRFGVRLYFKRNGKIVRLERERRIETKTVGDLIRYLSKFDSSTPIMMMSFVEDRSVMVNPGVTDVFGRLVLNADKLNLDDISFRTKSGWRVKWENEQKPRFLIHRKLNRTCYMEI